MKNKLWKRISVILLAVCLIVPIAVIMGMKSDAADSTLEEQVYEEEYTKSIVDLVKVKKAEDGTDIDGDATNGGLSDLEQMRNYIVEKTDAFYRTQGVKYEYDSTNACYYVTANQSCSAGITKAEGTLTVLSAYNDGTNGEATVTTVADSAFVDFTVVKTAVMPTITTLGTNAFQGCSVLETAVVKNRFKLTNDSFPDSSMSVDICTLKGEEPTLAMEDASGNAINAGLSGAVYLQNASGACETWKYDDSGVVVKAQHRHTYGEDDVCTNANCKMESVNGVAFEKNYFPARSASSINVEKVASYTDDNGVTETNVAKITTTGSVADVVFDFPEDVTGKLSVRLLVEKSDATHIKFRTVKEGTTGEGNANGVSDIAPGTGLPADKKNVWLDYTIDYSDVNRAYKDQLALMVVGSSSTEHVFYVAFAMENDKIQEKLESDLTLNYVADFDSSLYVPMISEGKNTDGLKATWLPSFEGETGVVKIELSGTNNAKDFHITLPKSHSGTYTLRMYVSSNTQVSQIGSCTSGLGWGNAFYASGYPTNSWETIRVASTSEDYDKEQIGIMGYGGSAPLEVYIAWIYDGTADSIEKDILEADLSADYLADFDSSLYQDLISENVNSNGLTTTWLSSFEGEEGVMKVELTSGATGKDFLITLPKSHSGKYTLRMYISSNTKVAQIGTCKSTGPGWANAFYADGYPTDSWQTITVDDSSADFNKEKIGIMGYGGSAPLEVYLAWIYDGTAEDWTKDTLAAELPADYYVADFDSSLYTDIISTGLNTGDTLETEWLSSFEGEEGVMRIKVTGNGTWKDFDITLPKSYTDTYTLRMYVSSNTNVYQIGTRTSAGAWGKWAGSYTTGQWQSIKVTDSKDELYDRAKINLAGYKGSETFEVYLAWILDGCNNITTAEETWRANTTSAVKTTLKSTLGEGYLADFSSADYASLIFGCNDIARDPQSITASYLESYTDDVNQVTHDGVLKVDVVCDNTGDFLVELPKSITQDSIKLRYAVVYGDDAKDASDYLRFKYPEKASCTGMYDTSGAIADLIGDGAWHEIEVAWGSSVKDYLEFQCSTDASGETVTIYFDEVTEAIP